MIALLARCWPFAVSVDADVRRSVGVLGVEHSPQRLLEAGYALATLFGAVVLLVAVPVAGTAPGCLLGAGIGLGLAGAVKTVPRTLAAFRRTRALGDVVELVGTLALGMQLRPVPERAARFAANSSDGLLARSLRDRVDRATGTPRTGLRGFSEEWAPWFPALERSVANLEAAADADSEHREYVLARSVDAVEAALNERVASFANELHGPVTGLYAFGVLLPLALVGTLPAATAAGVPVTPAVFVLAYDVLLPGCVAVAGFRLLANRPVAFPPPDVTVPSQGGVDTRLLGLVVAILVGGCGWFVGAVTVGSWAAPVAAAGSGLGAGIAVAARPVVRERRRLRELERGLSDALSTVGRAVADGDSVEAGVARAGEWTPGLAGEAFAEAARRRRLLGATVRRAFLGKHGPFADSSGSRSRTAVSLLTVAAREGKPAGDSLTAYADRLDDLLGHERNGRRSLAAVTRTLSHTGALFGPLVGGATVALAGRLAAADARLGGGTTTGGSSAHLPPSLVGTAVGCYVLLLAVVLTALATGLERGLDGSLVAYRVGIALLSAVGAFLVGVVGAGLLL